MLLEASALPAAHSMDATWFMVDDDGHVAEFSSGEEGAAPIAGGQDDGYEVLAALNAARIELPFVDEREPEYADLPDQWDAFHRGVYTFGNEQDYRAAIQPFWRGTRPLRPLTIDEVPAAVRASVVRLEGARFEESPLLQPFELIPCRTYRDQGLLSVADWEFFRWDDETRSYADHHAAEESYEEFVGRTYRVQPAAYLSALFASWRTSAVPELEPWWTAHEFIARLALDDESCAWLRDTLRAHRSRDALEGRLAKLLPRLATPVARAVPRVRLPSRPTLADPNAERRAALESLVSRGALPLSWLTAPTRRFLCDAREWLAVGTLDDLPSATQPMSLALASPELYERLARDIERVLAVESLVREERARSRGASSHDVVYWRVATAEAMTAVRSLVPDTQKSERVRRIESMGYAVDPVHTRFATALVPH